MTSKAMPPNPKDIVGAKKAPLRYVPPALALAAAGPMENGAIKYGPFNWREFPVEVVGYVEAVFRHLYAFLDGQDLAEDSGLPHIDHAIAGLGIVADARAHGTLIDNRFAAGPAADILRAMDKSVAPPSGIAIEEAWAPAVRAAQDIIDDINAALEAVNFAEGVMVFEGDDGTTYEYHFPIPPVYDEGSDAPDLDVTMRGVWPPDTRVAGLLTCCGASEHPIDCPQWR